MTESALTKSCPKCSSPWALPDRYTQGGERAPAYRSCSCELSPQSFSTHTDVVVQDLLCRVKELTGFVDRLLHLIPIGYVSSTSASAYMGRDLTQIGLKVPEHLLKVLIARGDTIYKSQHPAEEIMYNACLYCGDVSLMHAVKPEKGEPTSSIGFFGTCYNCQEIKRNHPEVMKWVTEILAFAYESLSWRPPHGSRESRNIIV